MRAPPSQPSADERGRRRPATTRTRATDKWSWKDGLHAFGVVGAVLAGVGGVYWSVETRLGAHDTAISVLQERALDQRQFATDMRVTLEKISLQITDLKVTAAGRGK